MDNIKQGQLVTWLQRWPDKAPQPLVGMVTLVYQLHNEAIVKVDGHHGVYRLPLAMLRRAERVVVAQAAQMSVDDAQREDSISDLLRNAGCHQ